MNARRRLWVLSIIEPIKPQPSFRNDSPQIDFKGRGEAFFERYSYFEAKARALGAAVEQVPFALSLALNRAATNSRRVLVETTWPSAVEVKNKSFIGRALRTNFSSKRNLRVEVYNSLGRANLAGHAFGGTKLPKGRALAIAPKGRFHRGAKGIPAGLRPVALAAATPRQALRIRPTGMLIGKGGKLELQYSFKPMALQPADVNFEEDFIDAMRRDVNASFPAALVRALRSAR